MHTSEKLRDSFALYDADHCLVDWDIGFVEEFNFPGLVLTAGMHYADILRASTADAENLRLYTEQSEGTPADSVVQERLDGFGVDRSIEYRNFAGRIVRIDETVTLSGGIRRNSRDVTDERVAGAALLKANSRLDAEDSDLGSAPIEILRHPDGNYEYPCVSEAMCRLLAFSHDSVGLNAMSIFSRIVLTPGQTPVFGAALERSAATMDLCSFEYRVRDGRNQLRWIRQSMMPRRSPDGTIVFAGVMRDVTREREAEDQVELLRSVVVRSSDSIAIFETTIVPDRQTKILYVNAKFTELFDGGCPDALVGRPIETLRPIDRDDAGRALVRSAIERNDGIPIELEAIGKEGRIFWVEIRVMTVQKLENGGFRWVMITRDISDRRHAQDVLIRAKEAAEAGDRAKGAFLANMSHELRTPLNAIIGFTDLIEQGVDSTGWVPSYREYLADVSGSGRHLLDLINTILDLSKIDAGQLKLDVQPVDLHELARMSLALVAGLALEGQIAISADIPRDLPEIPGDFLKLKQVLINILSNAIKFTPAGGKISLQVRLTDTQAVVMVTDTGCGIAEKDLERVMLRFVQVADSLSRKFDGSGLGLSIARELCTLHRGQLTIHSVEGQGTTVSVALPLTSEMTSVPPPLQAGIAQRNAGTGRKNSHALAA